MDFDQNTDDITTFWKALNRHQEPFLFQVFKANGKRAPRQIVTSKEKLLALCKQHKGSGILCLSVNPRDPDKVSSIESVTKIRNGVVDIDVRKERKQNGVSTTEDKAKAKKIAKQCLKKLKDLGIQPYLFIDSGNGFHIYFGLSLDLPLFSNKKEWRETILYRKLDQLTEELSELETDVVEIDCITKDIARRVKIPGTYNVKPEIPEDGEFRRAKILKTWDHANELKNNEAIKKLELTHKTTSSPQLGEVKEIKPEDKKGRPTFETILETFDDEKLKDLFEGKWEKYDYPSRSEAELALCQKLVFYQFGREEIKEIMPNCGIGKWQEEGSGYHNLTIKKALRYQEKRINWEEWQEEGGEGVYRYFDGQTRSGRPKNFNARSLMEDILEEYNIKTMENGAIWYYQDGKWNYGGKKIILEEATQRLGKFYRRRYKNRTLDLIKGFTFEKRENFNNFKWKIPLENGVFDIKKMEFQEGKTPELLNTYKIPVKFDRNADCPKIKDFLYDVVDSQAKVMTLLEFIGMCLVPTLPIQKVALMLQGTADNGKSVFLNLVKTFLGKENVATQPLQKLCDNTFRMAKLYMALVNVCADLGSDDVKYTSMFKKVTGRDKWITGERKYESPFNFSPHAPLMFSANKIPDAEDNDDAWYKRWCPLIFPYTFVDKPLERKEEVILKKRLTEEELEKELAKAEIELSELGEEVTREKKLDKVAEELGLEKEVNKYKERDPSILEKLTTEEELQGLLLGAIHGLKRVMERGRLTIHPSIEEVKDIFKHKGSQYQAYIMERLRFNPKAYIPRSKDLELNGKKIPHLHKDYLTWRKEEHPEYPRKGKAVFNRKILSMPQVEKYKPTIGGKQRKCFKGIWYKKKEYPTEEWKIEGSAARGGGKK